MPFIDTALKLEDVPVGQNRCLEFGDFQVGLFHQPNGLFAIDNTCPHRGAPLHQGMVSDGKVTCPWHQWEFHLEDGLCKNIPGPRVAVYPVEVRDGTIWIQIETPEEKKP